jgi:F-type H+-transporting ATPase subunit alpha
MLIFAGTRGYLDKIPVDNVESWIKDFLRYMDTAHPDVGRTISETLNFTDETEAQVVQALKDFNANWSV